MFGSLGWGLAMFFVGIALDHSTAFPDHPCGPEKQEKNYTICFATFSVLMGAALISATQIQFKYDYSVRRCRGFKCLWEHYSSHCFHSFSRNHKNPSRWRRYLKS